MSPHPRAHTVSDIITHIHATQPEVVFFDIGNVLVSLDFHELNLMTAERLGIPFDVYKPFLDQYMHYYFAGHLSSHHIEQIAHQELGITPSITALRTTLTQSQAQLNNELVAAITELSSTYTISCISNIFPESLEVLKELGIFDHFTAPFFSCEMGVSKPDPLAYHLALGLHDAPAKKTLFIDDKRKNLDAALEAGMQTMKYYFEVQE